jgi:Lipase (class 3)
MANCSSFAFTPLVEPTRSVTQTPPPAPFSPLMAYLLGQCCSLTYAQFDAGLNWTPDFSSLTLSGYTIKASSPQPLTVYEANEPGPTTGDVGDYYQVPAGFAVQLELTPINGGNAQQIVVVALRGTRTWEEWFADADGFPAVFGSTGLPLSYGLGSVHAGFYGLYTMGVNGQVVSQPLNPTWSQRAAGSIAYQVGQYVSQLSDSLPLYVTGHSLGGALAALCALDIAYNFPSQFSALYMYSLASPRVAAGISDSFGAPIPLLGNKEWFLYKYQGYVPNSYQIVHASDLVPILPPLATSLGPLTLSFAQVTDPFQLGSGATATASVSNGQVTSVTVATTNATGYTADAPPAVVFSGGGGSGATATATVYVLLSALVIEVTITDGGSGYTSAPTVEIVSPSGSLTQNVINFCAQTGDIGCNHGCNNTYLPYLAQLAADFQGA